MHFMPHAMRSYLCFALFALLSLSACDKAKDMNFTVTVNGKKMKVKGLKGLKNLATGKGGGAEAASGGSAKLVAPAMAGKMKLLAAKDSKSIKAGEKLAGQVLLCNVRTRFHNEKVGDRDSKRGLTFMKNRTISKKYSRFYCSASDSSDESAIIYTFIPMAFAKTVSQVAFGGQVNIKLLGRASRQWYGELAGIVALKGR